MIKFSISGNKFLLKNIFDGQNFFPCAWKYVHALLRIKKEEIVRNDKCPYEIA
jgi:hypothetical protein